jgi:4-amino-4-deoxy-L-arabinose transferase-like glycosyltransferase
MDNLIGITSISLICLLTLLLALRWPSVSKILYVALFVRIILLLVGHYIVALPDSTADAITFERAAWQLAQEDFYWILENFNGDDSRYKNAQFNSWLIAIPYSLFGRSVLMAKSMSLLVGMGSVFMGWLLAKKIWENHVAKKVGWVIALFPSLVLYSVINMREAYIVFFLLVALYGVISWSQTNNLKSIILAMTGFYCASLFHGAMMVGGIAFLGVVVISISKEFIRSLSNYRLNIKYIIIMIPVLIVVASFASNKFSIEYLGTFERLININYLISKTEAATRGVAAWPEWTIINSPIEMFYKAPIRGMYIVFAPFPWDVIKTKHLIGMFDAFLFMYLSFLIFKNIKNIWNNFSLRIIFIILLSYIFVFGIGVGNFGTGIRHRSKFVVMFILLAAPLIKKIVFIKNKKNLSTLKNTEN